MTSSALRSDATLVPDYAPSYRTAFAVSLGVLILYLFTLAPTVGMWDAGEYMASVKDFGLPHPPGNPLFMLVGHFFGLLPISESYAVRINVLAAFSSAVATGFWFLVTERVLVNWFPEWWQRVTGGVLAALIGSTAFTVWNQSVVNEKVYTLSLAFFAIVAWLMVRWADAPEERGADRILLLVAYLLGVGYANHPAGFLTAPAVFAVVAVRNPWKFIQADAMSTGKMILAVAASLIGIVFIYAIFGIWPIVGILAVAAIAWFRAGTIKRLPLVILVAGVLGLGLTPFTYLPIRAAHFPKMNSGEPTACLTEISASCTFSKETYKRTMEHIHREQYGTKDVRNAPFSGQVGMWWYYFKWQWLRDVHEVHPAAQNAFAVLFLMLGFLGGYVHWRKDRSSFWFFGPLVFTMTLALIYYLNFKYGATQALELGNSVEREVRDRDYFYIWSFSAWGVWAALGLVYLWETVAGILPRKEGTPAAAFPSRRNMFIAMPVLALAFIPLIGNWDQAPRRGETFTRDWAHDVLQSVEPYGILITAGDNDTYPLWYAQQVEGIRKDVLVIVTTYLQMNWAVRQLVRNPIFPYDSASGPAIYRGKTWVMPSGPPIKLSYQEIDGMVGFMDLPTQRVFRAGDLTATVGPGFVGQDQLMILYFLRDSYPQRPIFFSYNSTGVGLENHLVTVGLAFKLMPTIPTQTDSIRQVGDSFIDVPTSLALWNSVFDGPRSLIKQERWMDASSISIPYRYAFSAATLSMALREQGDTVNAEKIEAQLDSISKVAKIQMNLRR